jgi:hypothetical protein
MKVPGFAPANLAYKTGVLWRPAAWRTLTVVPRSRACRIASDSMCRACNHRASAGVVVFTARNRGNDTNRYDPSTVTLGHRAGS